MIRDIPIDRIIARPDARLIDEATVAGLAESIGAVGLINPIRVRAVGDQWEVVTGMHRLEASKRLGLVEIAADVVEADDLHAELAMIDENLCRAELSPSERAAQTARRKVIYIKLNPQTAHGVAGANARWNADEKFAPAFSTDTATKTGQSERLVQLNVERGEKVIPEVLEMIRGTKLDTGTYLDKLKGQTPNDQFHAAKRDLAHLRAQERERAGGMARRIRQVDIPDPKDWEQVIAEQKRRLMQVWNGCHPEVQAWFFDNIETPVFDRGAA